MVTHVRTNVRMYECTNVRMYECTYVRMYARIAELTDGPFGIFVLSRGELRLGVHLIGVVRGSLRSFVDARTHRRLTMHVCVCVNKKQKRSKITVSVCTACLASPEKKNWWWLPQHHSVSRGGRFICFPSSYLWHHRWNWFLSP